MTHHNVKRMHPLRMTPKTSQTRPAGCMTRLVVLLPKFASCVKPAPSLTNRLPRPQLGVLARPTWGNTCWSSLKLLRNYVEPVCNLPQASLIRKTRRFRVSRNSAQVGNRSRKLHQQSSSFSIHIMNDSNYSAQRKAHAPAAHDSENISDASSGLHDATCCASDLTSQTSENDNSSPDTNPSDASRECQLPQVQATRRTLLRFVECPELWRSLGGSDISHRLKYAILRWLELGAPDPVFGRAAGLWVDWVPLFEDWLRGVSAQRQCDGTAEREPEFKQEAERRLPCTACCASDPSDPFWGKLRAFTDFLKERQAARKAEPNFRPTKQYIREGMLSMVSGLQLISQGVQRIESCGPDPTHGCHQGSQGG